MSFPRYQSYKDSGVEWLGDVPEHWLVTKTKHVVQFTTGWTPPTGESASYEGANLWANISDLGPKCLLDTAKRVSDNAIAASRMSVSPKGSLMFSFKLSIGQVSFAGQDMFTNEAIATFLPSSHLSLAFAYYAFPLLLVQNAAENIYGAKLLNQELIRSASFALPSFPEQTQIAAFLDRETAKIDGLVTEQRLLMELLKEKRQAVISHAVTQGLNPHAPMKPSGIEWLGDVPAHWVIGKFSRLVSTRKGIAFKADHFTDDGVNVVKASDIKGLTIRQSETCLPNSFLEQYPRAILRTGELVLSTVGSAPEVRNSAVGQIGKVPEALSESLLNQNTVVFTPLALTLTNDFLFFILQTVGYRDHLDLYAHGTANQASINVSDMLDFFVPLPNPDEQIKITRFISEEFTKFDTLIAEANRAIALFQERRTALISAAVTGQIDVRPFVEREAA